jgi:cation transport ATPase
MDTASQRVTFPIFGLGCGGDGALDVERALQRVPGVRRAYVNRLTEMAYVRLDPARVRADQLAAKVRDLGLEAGPVQARS